MYPADTDDLGDELADEQLSKTDGHKQLRYAPAPPRAASRPLTRAQRLSRAGTR
jgi:hypothetical protein